VSLCEDLPGDLWDSSATHWPTRNKKTASECHGPSAIFSQPGRLDAVRAGRTNVIAAYGPVDVTLADRDPGIALLEPLAWVRGIADADGS
jgi:hypothetical protein